MLSLNILPLSLFSLKQNAKPPGPTPRRFCASANQMFFPTITKKALGRVFPPIGGKINCNPFFRGHVHRKKHFSSRQCRIGSPFDPILHAAGCFSLSKMQAFSRMSFTIPSQKIRTLSITPPQGSAMMYVSGRSEPAFIRTSSLSLFSLSNNTQSRRGPHPGGFVRFTFLMGSAPRPGGPSAAPAARQRPAEEPARWPHLR